MFQDTGLDRHTAGEPERADIGIGQLDFYSKIFDSFTVTCGNDRDRHIAWGTCQDPAKNIRRTL